MRNFTVMFMILILFLSIFFAIFKPPLKNSEFTDTQNEKTYVEKLLTEPKTTEIEQQTEIESQKRFENVEKSNIHENNDYLKKISQTKVENINSQTENFNTSNENLTPIKEESSNTRYEQISKELSEKYNNNPNAEISEEDLKYFLQKLIDNN